VDTATPAAPEKRDQQRCMTSGGDNGGEIDMLIVVGKFVTLQISLHS
jgi:hypothetical protein